MAALLLVSGMYMFRSVVKGLTEISRAVSVKLYLINYLCIFIEEKHISSKYNIHLLSLSLKKYPGLTMRIFLTCARTHFLSKLPHSFEEVL